VIYCNHVTGAPVQLLAFSAFKIKLSKYS